MRDLGLEPRNAQLLQLRRLLVRPLRQRVRARLEPRDALRLGGHLAARRRQRQLGVTPRVALALELGARGRRRLLARGRLRQVRVRFRLGLGLG